LDSAAIFWHEHGDAAAYTKNEMLEPEERALSIMRWIQ
jgi:hypothetical protein